MPNWCNNTFNVEGDKETIDKFETYLDEKNGKDWFDFFAPTPVELKEDGWYEWNVSNWGCKWNCDAQDWSRDGNTISFWFDSPWGPPVELYYKIEQAGLTVKAEYMEEGMRFVGEFVDGSDETYEYQDVEDLDNIPDNLVENWNLHDQFENWEDEDEE
jgi:hypothetical protein